MIFPTLVSSSVKLDKLLGRGGFSEVEEIEGFSLPPSSTSSLDLSLSSHRLGSSSDTQRADRKCRKFIAQHCTRPSGDARYALKHIREDLMYDRKLCSIATMDLRSEALILKRFQHPHIIKLRATVLGPDGLSGLVLDRLYGTLAMKILEWKKQSRELLSLFGPRQRDLLRTRILDAHHLGSALLYLHDNHVIHRDLKPENVGYDIRGDIKIFDFGLARELRREDSSDGMYKLSHMTGSLRYMAPEVYAGEPYNEKCDVYSFAVLFWEVLALEKPYREFKGEKDFANSVFAGRQRPSLKKKWSRPCRQLLENAWAPPVAQRWSMREVDEALRKELVLLGGGSELDLQSKRRRSTFVFENETSND